MSKRRGSWDEFEWVLVWLSALCIALYVLYVLSVLGCRLTVWLGTQAPLVPGVGL